MPGFQKMSNVDFFYLVKELAELKGARLNKVYGIGENAFRLKFNKTGEGEINLVIELGVRAHLTKFVPEAGGMPSAFVMGLRKRLENAVLKEVKQINLDRVIAFVFEKKERYEVVFEFLGRGNVLLLDGEGKIVSAFRKQVFSERVLAVGRSYVPPKQRGENILEANEKEFGNPKTAKGINAAFGIPVFYAEEALARADSEDGRRLFEECRNLFSHKISARVYFEGDAPKAFAPFELKKFSGLCEKNFESFSEALDEYYSARFGGAAEKPEALKRCESELARLRKALEQEEKAVAEFEAKANDAMKAGKWIKENHETVEQLIAEVKQERKTSKGKIEGKEIVLEA
jgi:predicted ribosome quality control (RQC) complex YloA/Tae2 family protein